MASAVRRSGRTSTGTWIGGAADAAGLHLDDRLEVGERLLEDVDARLAALASTMSIAP
jgi:hypothetical protein